MKLRSLVRIESIGLCLSCRVAATSILAIMRRGGIGKHWTLDNWDTVELGEPFFGVNIHRDGHRYGYTLYKKLSMVYGVMNRLLLARLFLTAICRRGRR